MPPANTYTKTPALQDEGPTSPEEQHLLGENYYYSQNGKPQNYTEAVKWYRKAVEKGIVYAQYNLGWMYENGRRVPHSDTEAAK